MHSNIHRSKAAVCIVSGGLDSICASAHLSENKFSLYMLTFSYGQRAIKELDKARYFARMLGAKDHRMVNIDFMKSLYGSTNALTNGNRTLPGAFDNSLVVPIRNAVFIAIAGAWAMSINAKTIAYGAHTGDIIHYPDCRPEFAHSMAVALNLAESDSISTGRREAIEIWSPAIDGLSKSALLNIGYQKLGDRIFSTWSCYTNGVKIRKQREVLQCGICESCINRKDAFKDAGIEDKTQYATKSNRNESKS